MNRAHSRGVGSEREKVVGVGGEDVVATIGCTNDDARVNDVGRACSPAERPDSSRVGVVEGDFATTTDSGLRSG